MPFILFTFTPSLKLPQTLMQMPETVISCSPMSRDLIFQDECRGCRDKLLVLINNNTYDNIV